MSSGEEEDDLAAALAFIDAYASPVRLPEAWDALAPLDLLARLDSASESGASPIGADVLAAGAGAAASPPALDAASRELGSEAEAEAEAEAGAERERSRGGAAKRRRPSAYNSNLARQKKHKELLTLRAQEQELELTLSVLRSAQQQQQRQLRRRGTRGDGQRAGATKESAAREAAVWQEIANRQLQHRAAAESELRRLRRMLGTQEKLIAELQNLVFCKATAKAMEALASDSVALHPRLRAVQQVNAFEFIPIMRQVEASYRGIDRVFQRDAGSDQCAGKARSGHMRVDANGHLYFEIFGSKTFPFDVQTTGDAAWKRFSYSVRPNDANIFSKFFDAPVNTISELFATELRLHKTKAVIQPKQVKRLFRERDRVVIVWQSQVDAVEFMGRALTGAEYEEKGYFLIERPPLAPEGFAVLRTCYVIAPTIPTHLVPKDSVAFALMKFVFKWMAATIPANHQILEDMLVLNAARRVRGREDASATEE